MQLSDDDLMVMFSAGTPEAFDMLYERYRHRIYGFAVAALHSTVDAEDIVQDVFLSVARSADRYRPQNRFKSWIFSIAANRIRAVSAREMAHREKTLVMQRLQQPAESRIRAADRAVSARDLLVRFLKTLPADQRMLLLLKELEGMDSRAIARAMGLTPANVRVRIHRLRKRLRETYQREFNREVSEL